MKKRSILVALLLGTVVALPLDVGARTRAPGDERWVFTSAFQEGCDGLVVAASGLVLTRSTVRTNATKNDGLVTAFDAASGAVVWKARYDGPDHRNDAFTALATNATGVFAIGQQSMADGRSLPFAVGIDPATGSILWTWIGRGWITDVEAPLGGSVIITGAARTPGAMKDVRVTALDPATGDPTWETWIDHGNDRSLGAVVSASGDRLFAYAAVDGTSRPGAVTAIDLVDGTVAWDRTYASFVWLSAVDPGGARLYGLIGDQVAAFGTTGGRIAWIAPSPGTPTVQDMATDAAGGLYVAGSNGSIVVMRFDGATGVRSWRRAHAGGIDLPDSARSIAVDAVTGTVYVTGRQDLDIYRAVSNDMVTLAIDAATGAETWAVVRDVPAGQYEEGRVVGLSVTGDTAVVCGATADNGWGPESIVIGYDATSGP